MVEFFFVAGKGGVGKTSTSSALSLLLSKKGKTLLVSTDPAHSLRHICRKKFKNRKKIENQLWVEEINPEKSVNPLGKKIFGIDISGPGTDEIAAFNQFIDLLNTKDFDFVVFDTAPTGHTLKLLALPDILDNWLIKIIQLKNKFGMLMNLFSKEKKEDTLEILKEKIKIGRSVMQKSHFYAVMIPEKMSILETKEAEKKMKQHGLLFEKIIINKVIDKCECAYCKAKKKEEEKNIKEIKKTFKKPVYIVPMFNKEVYGMDSIRKFSGFIKI